jgi:hypothetical protein
MSGSSVTLEFERFVALDRAIEAAGDAGRPGYARRCAALTALSSSEPHELLVARIRENARVLRGAPGVSGAVRPVFAAALAAARRDADDYLIARARLMPAMEGRRRRSLPAAALAYAAAGRILADATDRARIEAIAPLVAAPWWSSRAAWNGFFAAALALKGEGAPIVAARLNAAQSALEDAGAGLDLARNEARRLVLAPADPAQAAAVWRRLDDARRARRLHGRAPAPMLIAYAARAAHAPDAAAPALAEAMAALDGLRPRAHSIIRPFLAAGLAARALAPAAPDAPDAPDAQRDTDVAGALEAALLVVQANDEMAAIAAVGAATVAASG